MNFEAIKFGENLNKEIFSSFAETAAKLIVNAGAMGTKEKNSSTQLRKFYDELTHFHNKVGLSEDKYKQNEPFIQMLNAKVAYAEARDHVTKEYTNLMKQCLSQVTDAVSLKHCKLFMEAFAAYHRKFEEEKKQQEKQNRQMHSAS